jgi:hypothetical protein
MNKEELIAEAKRRYSIGDIIDQRTAYNGLGDKYEIKDNIVDYDARDGNISVSGTGVYHKKYGIWASVINKSNKYYFY